MDENFSEDQEHRKRLLEDHAHLESTVTNINTELENEKEKTRKTLKLAYLLRLEIAKVGFPKFSFFRNCIPIGPHHEAYKEHSECFHFRWFKTLFSNHLKWNTAYRKPI